MPARLVPVEVFADEGAALEDVVPVVDAAPPEAPMGLSTSATPPEVRMAPLPERHSLVLFSPRGFRVEGLDLDAVGALLERLG